jgi:hypothetical protein
VTLEIPEGLYVESFPDMTLLPLTITSVSYAVYEALGIQSSFTPCFLAHEVQIPAQILNNRGPGEIKFKINDTLPHNMGFFWESESFRQAFSNQCSNHAQWSLSRSGCGMCTFRLLPAIYHQTEHLEIGFHDIIRAVQQGEVIKGCLRLENVGSESLQLERILCSWSENAGSPRYNRGG